MQDLSRVHEAITSRMRHLLQDCDWDAYRLSEEQVEHFHDQGYVAGIPLVDDDYIAALREELAAVVDPAHPGHHLFHEFHSNESSNTDSVLFHSLGHWRIVPHFHDLLWNPRFLVPASQLLGGKGVRFWHDQLFCKPAQHGGVVAWHQDYSYWTRTQPMQHLTCWMGLDDADRDNGCLHYIPGSHRWGLLDKPELAGDMDGLAQYLSAGQQRQFEAQKAIELKRGHGSFHHPLMVHGSYENRSDRARRACVLNVFADGTQAASHEPLLPGVPPLVPGAPLDGQFFPLLYPGCD
ncbi:phytanoyl-CoA dioxygenase family protein [Simiduia agarivorans]|uniref:L-proline 4-hydroxylase n=1 Tax=Simiduia agarivorans (strain DSM 21679 / JCM 13881 / BCRC 17597 / SA1) TaxID=1117647 RepID=K4L2N7_SIMAS|nr:phytanoyl-CoA dioxygenase family protein [Simiduia agarivorans]AFV00463.2 L-proline 4-hydroxylase [Simiduia agarivorans SA1 = DSM 21679]